MSSPAHVLEFLAALALGVLVTFVPPLQALPEAVEGALLEELMRQEMPEQMAFADAADFSALPRDVTQLDHQVGWLFAAFERCGTIELDAFEGRWIAPSGSPHWDDAVVEDGRLQVGTFLRAEYCPVHVIARSEDRLVAAAVWHEDVHDPGDASLTYLQLTRRGETLTVCVGDDLDRPDLDRCVDLTAH